MDFVVFSVGVIFIFLWMFFAHTNSRFNALLLRLFRSLFPFLFRLHWVTWVKTITMYIVIGFCQWQKSRPQRGSESRGKTNERSERRKKTASVVKKNKTTSRITKPKIRSIYHWMQTEIPSTWTDMMFFLPSSLSLLVCIDSSKTCHRFLSSALLLLTFWFFISSALQPMRPYPTGEKIILVAHFCRTVRRERESEWVWVAVGILFTDFYYHNLYVRHIRTNHLLSVKAFLCDIEFLFSFICRCSYFFVSAVVHPSFETTLDGLLFAGLCCLFSGLIIATREQVTLSHVSKLWMLK